MSWAQLKKGIRVRRVSLAGALLGPEIPVSSNVDGPNQSSVGYDPFANDFFVAWAAYDYDPADNFAYAAGVRVQSGTGTVLGTPAVLKTSRYTTVPQVLFNPQTRKFLVVWYEQGSPPGPVFYGRMINGDGTFDGPVIPVTTYATYDALGMALNPVSNTYILATHDATAVEDLALEVSAAGIASPPIVATANGGTGNFNPRAASHASRPQWLMVTAKSFLTPVGQRIQTATVASSAPFITGPNTVDVQPGGVLTINGYGFGASQGTSAILLGTTPLAVQNWSDTQVIARVSAEAQSGAVAVVVNGAAATGPTAVVRRQGLKEIDFDGDDHADVATNSLERLTRRTI